ncbi:2,3-diaminopropionate biosynthesis protein SbnA [Mariniblastus sp.]|nr:2,3-diaminopropionate biosynthesis protein SbnA [Mariniblastus sp.]
MTVKTGQTTYDSSETCVRQSAAPQHVPFKSDGILQALGNTPLVRLRRFLDDHTVKLFAKLESFNPGGSAKDRPAIRMIEQALKSGKIDSDTTVIESSSGNMGVALSQICRYHSMRFICVVDPNAQLHNVSIMRALGAEIVRVDQMVDGSYLAARWRRVRELLNTSENSFWPNQYANLENPKSHEATIREICRDSEDGFDYLFVATSSTGTATGCQNFLHRINHPAKVIAVDAIGSVLFGGTAGPRRIPGLGAGCEPALAVGKSFDGLYRVSNVDCVVGCRRAAEREAILVGGSGGGVLQTIRYLGDKLAGKTCVAILHDSGYRYLDTIFNDDWVKDATSLKAPEIRYLAGIETRKSSNENDLRSEVG